jgi:hypothetical protein
MRKTEMRRFVGGLGIGQAWWSNNSSVRVVTIDPAMHTVNVESASGQIESDTIEHFLATHQTDLC